jgi:histidine triad (HIT) family protein
MDSCIFCKIVKGTIPCSKVYETTNELAFLDIRPSAKGHTLVIPKHHAETMMDMDVKTAPHFMETLQKVTQAVMKSTGAKGCNIVQNNYPVAGQIVPHVHFHIVPRNEHDGHDFSFKRHEEYKEGDVPILLKKMHEALR